jgi:hypothetical protein
MTTIFLIAFCITAGFVTGLAWRWYEGEVEVRGDSLTPLRCAQINATVIWCGIKGLARAIVAQAVIILAKCRKAK